MCGHICIYVMFSPLVTWLISIGSLGKEQGMAVEAVQNVTVKTTWFTGTTNGLRIKTWGSSKRGFVSGVDFIDSTMTGVQNPIIIDQNYCPDKNGCGTHKVIYAYILLILEHAQKCCMHLKCCRLIVTLVIARNYVVL